MRRRKKGGDLGIRLSTTRKQVITVKRQFMPLNTSQGPEYHPARFASGEGWSTAEVNTDDSSAQPQEGPPPQATHHPAGSRLLSNCKSKPFQSIRDAEKSAQI